MPTQLDIAKKCGADVILNATKVNVVEEVQKLTGGFGCDVYVEATGHPLSVKQGWVNVEWAGLQALLFHNSIILVHEVAILNFAAF